MVWENKEEREWEANPNPKGFLEESMVEPMFRGPV
jgi:hypothetical protein